MGMRFDSKRIAEILIQGVVLSIPIQLGRHFWPSWSLLLGRRIDYLSPTVYFVDCLIVAAVVFACSSFLSMPDKQRRRIVNAQRKYFMVYALSAVLVFINIITSLAWQVSVAAWIHVMLFGFVAWYIATHANQKTQYLRLLIVGGVCSAVLAIGQFALQHSIGGVFWFVGERLFTIDTASIARAHICMPFTGSCQLLLRSYATFPHPNVLAAYLGIVLFLFVTHIPNVFGKKPTGSYRPFIIGLTIMFLILALITTMGRATFVVVLFLLLWWYMEQKQYSGFAKTIVAGVAIFCIVSALSFLPLRVADESVVVRQRLNQISVRVIARHMVSGVGLGNFVITLPRETSSVFFTGIQPVHNVYLLAISELGVLGIVGWIVLCVMWWRRTQNYFRAPRPESALFLALILAMGALGLVDHYWWTLEQGQLLASVVFGLYLASRNQQG